MNDNTLSPEELAKLHEQQAGEGEASQPEAEKQEVNAGDSSSS